MVFGVHHMLDNSVLITTQEAMPAFVKLMALTYRFLAWTIGTGQV